MTWDIPNLLHNLVSSRLSKRTDHRTEPDGGLATGLYSCPDCGTTYISEEMESCSECNVRVEQIPSERDLGF